MKFKQKSVQNQRIEKITTDHLVVGIDISKDTHIARAVNFRGIELGKPCKFSNNQAGFVHFLQWIDNQFDKHGKSLVIIGMEPTGHYWKNMAYWLVDQKLEIVIVNPHHVKKNKENRDNSPTKNDTKDALVIADMVRNGYYSELNLPTKVHKELRDTMSLREFINKQRVSVKNQIHRWLDLWFPEYLTVFKDWSCKTSLATLRLFPTPAELKKLTSEKIIVEWKSVMKRRGNLNTAKLLIEAAKNSIACDEGMNYAKTHLTLLLDQLDQLTCQLEKLEQQAVKLVEEMPESRQIQQLKGISPTFVAGILAETGSLSNYTHGNQILRLAGLHLSEDSSGKHKGQTIITKRGRPQLRKILYLITFSLVKNNPEFRLLHEKNVTINKMRKKQSIIKLCGKLARILIGITSNQEPYNPEKVLKLADVV
ncbi:transposase [Desulfosporosinus sp. HMP52]|uniref:IS110 family transposase n=1 Tax=Desulfosporosinus sp. HMP52 TaxID=1487923 RepID=UPI00051FEA95|nr:IS110 family transposase [Desulfosporosinus sp. HMP52]KGK87444.1 transposase [Desulfosporosinus sp. HMP52]